MSRNKWPGFGDDPFADIVKQTHSFYDLGDRTVTLKATVPFDELPPGVTFAKGAVLSFTADVEKDDSKKVKDTAAKVEWVRTTTLTGRILTSAKRAGKPLAF